MSNGNARLAFRCDKATRELIAREVKRLRKQQPGISFTMSDALRRLIHRNAEGVEDKLPTIRRA